MSRIFDHTCLFISGTTSTVGVVSLMKTARLVENSGHCIYSIGLKCFLKLLFAVSFSDLYIYIWIARNE